MLPPSLKDWLPEKHPAYLVSQVVEQLRLLGSYAVYEGNERGHLPYDLRMKTKLLVYEYCVGVYSARKIAQRLVEDVAFRVLADRHGSPADRWKGFSAWSRIRPSCMCKHGRSPGRQWA